MERISKSTNFYWTSRPGYATIISGKGEITMSFHGHLSDEDLHLAWLDNAVRDIYVQCRALGDDVSVITLTIENEHGILKTKTKTREFDCLDKIPIT